MFVRFDFVKRLFEIEIFSLGIIIKLDDISVFLIVFYQLFLRHDDLHEVLKKVDANLLESNLGN